MTMIVQNVFTPGNAIEKSYQKETSAAHRKEFGQIFTPYPVAALMGKWITGHDQLRTVLEPAFGLGVFSRALLAQDPTLEVTGFEVDATILAEAHKHFASFPSVSLLHQDYMYHDWENKYDGIICNPPYFKFHDYDNKGVLQEIETRLKIKLSGFTNLYSLFLLKSIYQLNPGGRAAYLIPSEFLNADYGKLVKSFLLKSKVLRHIVVVDFGENVFEDALTTACLIFCANDQQEAKVQFSNVESLQDFQEVEALLQTYPVYEVPANTFKVEDLDPNVKWRTYYQTQNSLEFKHLVPFSAFGKVVRGIATGANNYFTFSREKAAQQQIPAENLLPCVCKSIDCKTAFFTAENFEELVATDRPAFLFNALAAQNEAVRRYISQGEQEEIDQKYLTANRTPWYALEKRPPAPIWVSVFNRTGLRFIRNEANVSNLTTFHCIYPKASGLFQSVPIDVLFAYLLTDTARLIFEDNRREYGNGLQKFEPNDINKGMMLDLRLLVKKDQEQIIDLYQRYRTSVLEGAPEPIFIDRINEVFLKKYT